MFVTVTTWFPAHKLIDSRSPLKVGVCPSRSNALVNSAICGSSRSISSANPKALRNHDTNRVQSPVSARESSSPFSTRSATRATISSANNAFCSTDRLSRFPWWYASFTQRPKLSSPIARSKSSASSSTFCRGSRFRNNWLDVMEESESAHQP